MAMNAFTLNWVKLQMSYANPPWNLIGKVLVDKEPKNKNSTPVTNIVASPTGNVDTQTPPTTKHARSDTTNSLSEQRRCEAQSSRMDYLRDDCVRLHYLY